MSCLRDCTQLDQNSSHFCANFERIHGLFVIKRELCRLHRRTNYKQLKELDKFLLFIYRIRSKGSLKMMIMSSCLIVVFMVSVILQQLPIVTSATNMRQIEKNILDKIIGQGYDSRIRPSGANATRDSGENEWRGLQVSCFARV